MTKIKEKKGYIEWLRIIAILFVIYNHTRTLGFELFKVTTESTSYWLSYIMYPLCKVAVPIFFMISGANLLGKQESLGELFKKRILKHALIILLFGTVQYFRYVRAGKVALSVAAWIGAVYSQPLLETYWFLYLYLGFLLILPFLRKAVISMEKRDYIYLLTLYIVCNILAVVGYFTGYFINSNVFEVSTILFYPLLGYGVEKYGEEIKAKWGVLAIVVTEIIVVAIGVIYSQVYPESSNNLTNLIQLGTPVLSFGIFLTVKYLSKGKSNKLINALGSTVFGIYLIEDIVRNQFEKIIIRYDLTAYLNDFVVGVLFVFATFVCSAVVIYIVKLIPFVKKMI